MNSLSDLIKEKKQDLHLPSEATSDTTTQEDVSLPSIDPIAQMDNTFLSHDETSEKQEAAPVVTSNIDVQALKTAVYSMKEQLDGILRLLNGQQVELRKNVEPEVTHAVTGERIVEGVFNGEKMIGSDGKEYPVPPNYASKSKLVEGDLMKLTITNAGSFLYKQVGPIPRKRIVGELLCDLAGNQWSVLAEGRPYKILTASVTFYKGKAGDECVILVPEDGESNWGAVENIIAT